MASLRGGWYGDVLRKRGSDRATMAYNGGRDGKRYHIENPAGPQRAAGTA